MDEFLQHHADAIVVDVREPVEQLVAPCPAWSGRQAVQLPLSQLVNQLDSWLGNQHQPLVFVCRSGARSSKAATCLRRLGHRQAWHLAGGLAMADTEASTPETAEG